MDIAIPTIPLAVVTLLSIFAPYAVALINQPFWPPTARKVVAIVVSLVLSAIVLLIYFAASGDPVPQWWILLLLGLFVSQTSYTLITKRSASNLELASSPIRA